MIRRPSPAMVVALIALFVSASGVTWAATSLPRDSVKSKQVVNGSLQAKDLGVDSVTADQIADDSVDGGAIQDDAVEADEIAVDAVESDEIAMDAVGTEEVADGSLLKDDLSSDSVGGLQIGDQIVNRPADEATLVEGGTAENNSYRIGTSTSFCDEGELITGFGQWEPDDADDTDAELTTVEVLLDQDAESVTVVGGNDSGVDHDLRAVAVCLLP